MTKTKLLHLSITVWILCFSMLTYGRSIHETQRSLQQLDHKIQILEKKLSKTQARQARLQKELDTTEALIKKNKTNLAEIEQQLSLKKTEITRLEQKIADLNQEFLTLQQQLSQQITARYKHPATQPLGWIFLQKKHTPVDKLLTYYQYVIRASKDTLNQVKSTQVALDAQQNALQKELHQLHQMQAQQQIEQDQLQRHQNHHQSLLYKLHHRIEKQEKKLTQYQRNHNNLTRLLRKLNRQSVVQTRQSMTKMKHKLPSPVQVNADHIEKLNQGIMLYAADGSPVQAVYPGKVVFSEWLNGYGLLLIIDHGWGMMTLYANNATLTHQKGDTISQGEQIATVGHQGISKESGLYFEIRQHGKAMSPRRWLAGL
ncbi:MAG: peptidoglycan DD-metalloendopeptidase family protein [Gammaproteobacteria bacterium]|nr:peptidoglycan DD-metalloendopeptidase family protein [Gammaproteobacteria bacterium]